MNIDKQTLFQEGKEIVPKVFESSSSQVLQHLKASTIKLTATSKPARNSYTTAKRTFQHFDDHSVNSESTTSDQSEDSQPGPSGVHQNETLKSDTIEVSTSVINTAKLLCKSGKINTGQFQQLLKYITHSRSVTSGSTTTVRTDQAKLNSLIGHLTQQPRQVLTTIAGSQLDGHQVQSSEQQIYCVGQSLNGSRKPGVSGDLCKTISTVHSICHPAPCQTIEFKTTGTSSYNRSVVTKMLQGVEFQAFTPVDQALSLFEVSPTIHQDTTQFHSPGSLSSMVSDSYGPTISSAMVKATTPTQMCVGRSLDNGMIDANDTTGWEYSGANLADLLIPDTSGSDAATEDNDSSSAFLTEADEQMLGAFKTGQAEELSGTSGISYRDSSLQSKTHSDVDTTEFYCSPEKMMKLESSTIANTTVSGGFSEFVLPALNSKSSNLKRKRYKKTADALQGSGLMDITVKTAELIQKNSKLQKDINQLKREAAQFCESVLQNPENRVLREKLKMAE